ncbi:hypothetical protein QTP88_023989 [Uroleucon formosanum]
MKYCIILLFLCHLHCYLISIFHLSSLWHNPRLEVEESLILLKYKIIFWFYHKIDYSLHNIDYRIPCQIIVSTKKNVKHAVTTTSVYMTKYHDVIAKLPKSTDLKVTQPVIPKYTIQYHNVVPYVNPSNAITLLQQDTASGSRVNPFMYSNTTLRLHCTFARQSGLTELLYFRRHSSVSVDSVSPLMTDIGDIRTVCSCRYSLHLCVESIQFVVPH